MVSGESVFRRRRWRMVLSIALSSALLAGVVVLGIYGVRRGSSDVASSAPNKPVAHNVVDDRPTLLVVGDYVVAVAGDPDMMLYPQIVADRLGWHVRVDAAADAAFVADPDQSAEKSSRHFGTFADRLPLIASQYRVDYVVIDGGRNDLWKDPSEVAPAIAEYLARARQSWPEATIVAVKPALVSETVQGNYDVLSSAIDEAAVAQNIKVIDPVAELWFVGDNVKALVTGGGVHMTQGGQQLYADRIMSDLEAFGVTGAPMADEAGPR